MVFLLEQWGSTNRSTQFIGPKIEQKWRGGIKSEKENRGSILGRDKHRWTTCTHNREECDKDEEPKDYANKEEKEEKEGLESL